MHAPKTLPRNAGLTLIEVLTTVSLIGILTALAANNFTSLRPSFDTRAAALMIAGDLNQARMSAIKEARVYDYFPIAGGYQIRHDDGAGNRIVVTTRVLNQVYPDVSFGHTGITQDPYAAAIASSAPTATMTFQSNGTVTNAAGMFVQAGSGDMIAQQAVTVSAAGRVRAWKWGASAWH